jgi:hypothetical protein
MFGAAIWNDAESQPRSRLNRFQNKEELNEML